MRPNPGPTNRPENDPSLGGLLLADSAEGGGVRAKKLVGPTPSSRLCLAQKAAPNPVTVLHLGGHKPSLWEDIFDVETTPPKCVNLFG